MHVILSYLSIVSFTNHRSEVVQKGHENKREELKLKIKVITYRVFFVSQVNTVHFGNDEVFAFV